MTSGHINNVHHTFFDNQDFTWAPCASQAGKELIAHIPSSPAEPGAPMRLADLGEMHGKNFGGF